MGTVWLKNVSNLAPTLSDDMPEHLPRIFKRHSMADTAAVRKADAPGPKLIPETFKQLRDLIYEMTGIHFQDNKTYLLESRLLPRLKACRCQAF